MARAVTRVYQQDNDANRRLSELGMDRDDIVAIRDVACSMSATGSSPFFPANGAGQLAYQYGTRELREKFLSRGWRIDQSFGTSGVRHEDQKIVVIYQNVDTACSLANLPKPRSRKGAGSERLGQKNAFEVIEDEVPSTYSVASLNVDVWYVMVSESGAVEVTHAVVKNGEFSDFVERIFVDDGSGFSVFDTDGQDNDDDAIDFNISVSRK